MKNKPPLIIDSAKVLKYAIVDNSVEYTGRLCLYVGDKRLGKVPRLAICQNYKAKDYLLLFCDEKWKVIGASGNKTIKEAQRDAEKYYKGITKKWVTVARPNKFKDWPGDLGPICSFCGKTFFEGPKRMFQGKNAHICNQCIEEYQNIISTEKEDEA